MLEVISGNEIIQYPVARRSLHTGTIVLFLSENGGVVIGTTSDSKSDVGYLNDDWTSCSDESIWEPVNITITG